MELRAAFRPRLADADSLGPLLTYAVSVAGTMGASFALVLILVRLLPAEVYGELVLLKLVLLVAVSLAGVGLSQAAVRWLNLEAERQLVLGTVLSGAALCALPATAAFTVVIGLFPERFGLSLHPLLVVSLIVLVPSYVLNNELLNWPRALHQPGRHAAWNTTRAVGQLACITLGVLLTWSSEGFVYGLAVGELLFTVWLALGLRGRLRASLDLLRQMLHYGWPHTVVIASSFLLTYADRYMLAFLTGDTTVVAHYDAAYVVVSSALALLARPFNLFLFPAYTRRYSESGKEATIRMVNTAQHYFLFVGLAVASLIVLFRAPILDLLYPAGYQGAASIFSAVAFGALLNGLFMATVAGLYISRNTLLVGVSALVALLVNVIANWLLIPSHGMDAAAFSTALAAAVQLLFGYYFARSILPVSLPVWWLCGGVLWLSLMNWITL